MRVVDIKLGVPINIAGPGACCCDRRWYTTVIIVIAVLLWARYARIVRGEALAIKQQDFIDRARVSGASK